MLNMQKDVFYIFSEKCKKYIFVYGACRDSLALYCDKVVGVRYETCYGFLTIITGSYAISLTIK